MHRKTPAREGDQEGLRTLTCEQRWTGSEGSARQRAGGAASGQGEDKARACSEGAGTGKILGEDHIT